MSIGTIFGIFRVSHRLYRESPHHKWKARTGNLGPRQTNQYLGKGQTSRQKAPAFLPANRPLVPLLLLQTACPYSIATLKDTHTDQTPQPRQGLLSFPVDRRTKRPTKGSSSLLCGTRPGPIAKFRHLPSDLHGQGKISVETHVATTVLKQPKEDQCLLTARDQPPKQVHFPLTLPCGCS